MEFRERVTVVTGGANGIGLGWIMDVDLWGPIYGVNVFLPLIEAAGEGHINTTSSMAGLIPFSSMSAYNVAKHGANACNPLVHFPVREV